MADMKELIARGGEISAEHSKYFYKCKKEQAGPFGFQIVPQLISSDSEAEEESRKLDHNTPTSHLKNLLPKFR